MVFEIMEFEIARAEMLAQTLRMLEHSEIAVAHLCHAAVGPRLEHIAGEINAAFAACIALCRKIHGFQ